MYKSQLLLICFILSFSSLVSQNQQPGGFDHEWINYNPSEFQPVDITFDYTDCINIEAAPPIGVHPRIYLGPSELPDLVNRLTTEVSGQEAFAQIHAYTTLLHKGYNNGSSNSYQHNSSYGQYVFNNRRISNAGKWDSNIFY